MAVFATARKIAQILYRLLRYGQEYVDITTTSQVENTFIATGESATG